MLHRADIDPLLRDSPLEGVVCSWPRMAEFCVSHNWSQNDVAVCNNSAMQHHALADYAEVRVDQRVTFVDPSLDFRLDADRCPKPERREHLRIR